MELLSHSADFFVHVAFWTLIHSLWQGTVFAAALAIWRAFAAERDYAARTAAATLTLLFLAAAPTVTATSIALAYEPPPAPSTADDFDFSALAAMPSAHSATEGDYAGESPVIPLSFDTIAARLPYAIALLWTIGVTCGAARLLASAVRLHLVRTRSIVADDGLSQRCRELAKRCGLAHAPRLLRSLSARGPYAFGLFRPCIVVPAAWALETSADVLEAAIAHELAHLKRRDLWILALQRLVETTLFFHPAVWYVSRTLNADRERDADRLAAEVLGDPARYAESLCRLASLVVRPGSPALTLPFHGETRMNLLERMRHVLRTEEAKSGGYSSVGWLCLAPALLAAIFICQAAFVGSVTADEGDREGASATDVEDDGPEGREEEAKDRDEGDSENESRLEEEEEETDDADGVGGLSAAETRRSVAEVHAEIDEMMRRRAEELEQKYKAHIQAAQEELKSAMQRLQAEAKERKTEVDQQIARLMAQRQADAQRRAEEERPRVEGREELPGADADDLTPRERRMLGVIRSLEARLQELESRLPRDGERREEGAPREERREGDQPREERREEDKPRDGDQPREERREGERKEEAEQATDRLQPRSEEEAQERQFAALSERLYKALRSDELSEERRAEFARRAILDVFGYELSPEQLQTVLERSRGDLGGFREALSRLSQEKKE